MHSRLIVCRKVMNVKIKTADSFNFLRAICCIITFNLILSYLRTNVFLYDKKIRVLLIQIMTTLARAMIFHIPFLWFYTHEKAKEFIEQRKNKIRSQLYSI